MKSMRSPWIVAAAALILSATWNARAQNAWSGELGLSVAGLSSSGSENSFLTQSDLRDGFNLEALRLAYSGNDDARDAITLEAWGFGGAMPWEHAALRYQARSPLTLTLEYDKRSSFFSLAETELGLRRDDWEITSWKGRLLWDGWSSARLILDLRRVERTGEADRPFYGLNDVFPVRVDLDETMSEAALRFETSTLPVKFTFDQAYTVHENRNRYEPGSGDYPDNPNDLAATSTTRNDEVVVSTSHMTAAYAGDRFDFAAAALYSPSKLESEGLTSSAFAIGGGTYGQLEFIDDLTGSADRDSVSVNARIGALLGRGFRLRLTGDHRDATTDGSILGQRIIRARNPAGGTFDLTGPLAAVTTFDSTDSSVDASLEWTSGSWSVWGGGFTASREVAWDLAEGQAYDVTRDSDGLFAGIAWRGSRLSFDADYRSGTFERYVFRTDPETVDRLTVKIRGNVVRGWTFHLGGFSDKGENPSEAAGLDRKSTGWSGGIAWNSAEGNRGFGLDFEALDLTTETGLVLPTGAAGESIYDLSLLTTSAWGRATIGRIAVSGSLAWVDDSGETWPIESIVAKARASYPVAASLDLAVFGEYWSYEEERGGLDDYDVTRYGVTLTWRFE